MPVVRPFRAIHYDFERYADLSPVLSPPYHALDDEACDRLEALDPHNAVRLEGERERPGDGGAENRYNRSGRLLAEWMAQRVLVRDGRPAILALEQRFESGGAQRVRRGFLASLELERPGQGVVVPHEPTDPELLEDRLRLFEATKIDTSPLFAVYPDDAGDVLRPLEAIFSSEPTAQGTLGALPGAGSGGVEHRLWRVDDPAVIRAVASAMALRRAYLVDGHNRYETALLYAARRDAEGADPRGAHHGVLAYFCSMTDPGLVLLPTHRLVEGVAVDFGPLLPILDEHFDVETLVEDVSRPAGRAWALRRLHEARRSGHAFVMVTGADRKARLLRLKEGIDLAHVTALPKNPTLRALDVTLLHGLLLQHTLGLSPSLQAEHVELVPDAGELVAAALSAKDRLGFLLEPTPAWQVRAVAEAGETLPPGSASFDPKIPAGLAFLSIDPREGA